MAVLGDANFIETKARLLSPLTTGLLALLLLYPPQLEKKATRARQENNKSERFNRKGSRNQGSGRLNRRLYIAGRGRLARARVIHYC
jgi:hypothetical protein